MQEQGAISKTLDTQAERCREALGEGVAIARLEGAGHSKPTDGWFREAYSSAAAPIEVGHGPRERRAVKLKHVPGRAVGWKRTCPRFSRRVAHHHLLPWLQTHNPVRILATSRSGRIRHFDRSLDERHYGPSPRPTNVEDGSVGYHHGVPCLNAEGPGIVGHGEAGRPIGELQPALASRKRDVDDRSAAQIHSRPVGQVHPARLAGCGRIAGELLPALRLPMERTRWSGTGPPAGPRREPRRQARNAPEFDVCAPREVCAPGRSALDRALPLPAG